MIERWQKVAPFALGAAFAAVPFFPAFITLTNVQFPGISVVPLPVALAILGLMVVLAVWATIAFFLPPRTPVPLGRPLLAWWASCMLSVAVGLNPHDGLIFIGILGLAALWHIGVIRYYDARNATRAIYWALLCSAIVSCVLAIAMVVLRVPAAQYAIAHGRAVGTFVLPGELAGYLIVVIPLAYGVMRVARSRALRGVAATALGLGIVTMVLTFSRTGWVGLACAAAFFVAAQSRERRRGLFTGAGIVLGVLLVVVLLFNARHNPSENYTRISIWQAAIGAIDRFPLLGAGPFGFSHLYPLVRLPDGDATAFHAHSMYLTFFAELGIVGLAAFGWILWSFAREMYRRLAVADPAARTLGLALAAGLVGTLVQGLIDTVSVIIFGLFLPTLALALAATRSGTGDA